MAATAVITPADTLVTPAPISAPAPAPISAPAPAPAAAPSGEAPAAPASRRVDPLNYESYIHTISKQVHPSMHISADTLTHVNTLLVNFAKKVIRTADAMAASDKVVTLNLKEIKAAIPGLLPEDMIEPATTFADEAVRSFDPKLLEGPKRPKRSSNPASPSAPASPALAPVPVPAPAAPTASPAPSPAPEAAARRKPVSRATRAGLIIPPSRIESMIREHSSTKRVGGGGPLYLAAIVDFLARDLLALVGAATQADRIITLKPRHIIMAITKDDDLAELFGYWVVQQQRLTPTA